TSGPLTVTAGQTVQLSGESTVGWSSSRWEIYSFPTGWSTPAGWTLDSASQVLYYLGTTPPVFTVPSTTYWGKFMIRLTVNGGVKVIDGKTVAQAQFVDEATALSLVSDSGYVGIGFGEQSQFDSRAYQKAIETNMRLASTTTSVATPYTPPAKFITPDANTKFLYLLGEAGTPFANTGSLAPAGNLPQIATSVGGFPKAHSAGLTQTNAVNFGADYVRIYETTDNLSAIDQVPYPITVEAWFVANQVSSSQAYIFGRSWAETHTDPYFAWMLSINANEPQFDIAVGSDGAGVRHNSAIAAVKVPTGVGCHIGMTYDGATWKKYFNGNLIHSESLTGAIDYNTVNVDAELFIGGDAGGSTLAIDGTVERCAIHNVVRDASYFREQYLRGVQRY
ncbi:MAG TPA: LamG-like jellyroll fold domain-containing protein, partial [Candidatus Acidoferrales bacterium]|nr:LamG-like jellyroll fold domain-containing protein [Candidatus Acidoferrales bacterium]